MSGIDIFGMLLIAAMVIFFVLFAALMSNLSFKKVLWIIWSYKGRINRKTFWISYVLMFLVISFFREVDQGILIHLMPEFPMAFFRVILAGLVCYPLIPITFKRLHDTNSSGWSFFLCIVPVIGQVYTLIQCGFIPGTKGKNRYGTPPE